MVVMAARRKTPSFVRLHSVVEKALQDTKRGHVVEDDVEVFVYILQV